MPTPVVPQQLYHYTCVDHGYRGIHAPMVLRPFPQPLLGGRPLVWLTDLETPDAWALGLTNHTLCCSRTEIRCSVRPHENAGQYGITPWWEYARGVNRVVRDVLEQVGLPMHWWVTELPVCVDAIDVSRSAHQESA